MVIIMSKSIIWSLSMSPANIIMCFCSTPVFLPRIELDWVHEECLTLSSGQRTQKWVHSKERKVMIGLMSIESTLYDHGDD